MSVSTWLKATQRRVKETILQSVGAHDKTDDGHFDQKYQSFVTFSRDLAKVHLSMQLWLDSIDLVCASSVGIGESLTSFCSVSDAGNCSPLLDIARCFHAISSDINTIVRTTLRSTFIDRCMKPIESILAVLPVVQEKMQKRKALRLDADFYRSKLASEQGTGKAGDHPTVTKISNKLNEANKSLHMVTSELISLIDELNAQRQSVLGPEIAAMMACMQTLHSTASSHLSQLSPLLPQSASTTCLLLASFETQRGLWSPPIVEELLARTPSTSFPLQPVLVRPAAAGGATGGYGYTPMVNGVQSSMDSLLRASAAVGSTPDTHREAPDVSEGGSSAPWDGSLQPTQRVMSSKRQPAIKLGMDLSQPRENSISSLDGAPAHLPDTSAAHRGASVSLSKIPSAPAPSRPVSLPVSSNLTPSSPSSAVFSSPLAGGSGRGTHRSQRPSVTSGSMRLTATAAAQSGSPQTTLGVVKENLLSPSSSLDDAEEKSHCHTTDGTVLFLYLDFQWIL